MILKLIDKIISKFFKIQKLLKELNELKILTGLNIFENRKLENLNLNQYELKIFSQFGEDGIIDFLTRKLKIKSKYFIEFGVEDYTESNTRFLLEARNWSGEIYESNKKFVESIKKENLYWRHNLSVKNVFISKNNINSLINDFLKKNRIKNLGLLSIDIDGVDYWIWKELKIVNPDLVIIEYNARLGPVESIVVPYKENFERIKEHHSSIYFGASLTALYKLGIEKGYSLVGTNYNGSNAFFVKKDLIIDSGLAELNPQECFNKNSFNELRSKTGFLLERDIEKEKVILSKMNFIKV